MSENAKKVLKAVGMIIAIAVAYEVYKPLGVALVIIALVTLFLRGKA